MEWESCKQSVRETPREFSLYMRRVWIPQNQSNPDCIKPSDTTCDTRCMSACCCMLRLHACVSACACLFSCASGPRKGAVDYCWNVSVDMWAQRFWDARGFQEAMIIHCVTTNLWKIRCTGCIQGNRIALTVFDSPRHANMIFGLLHYRTCHPGPVGKRCGYTV